LLPFFSNLLPEERLPGYLALGAQVKFASAFVLL
jgi:hypothetical protein